MFFPRLRNQAKWAFVFLILVFAGGFVFLGVGSGGLDLGQLLRDAFGNKGSSGVSVSEAQERVRERPLNPVFRRQLAQALEGKGRTDEAIAAWLEYGKLRPKDVVALRHVGDLELKQAGQYYEQAQLAALQQQESGVGSAFRPSGTSGFGKALGQDPIGSAIAEKASAQFQDASLKYETFARRAVSTYEQLVKLRPDDVTSLRILAQTADAIRDADVAVPAYKKLLKFATDPSEKAQIRERIKTLQQGTGG